MKITKTKLKQIIKEELENLEEYSPYKTGARPDKPHKKPGEIKDDGKYADPKRARPKKRYEEQEELENVIEGVEKAWCVGFEKDGEMHHERVYADAGGVAERKIKKKHDIGDDAIKSTKEGECKR